MREVKAWALAWPSGLTSVVRFYRREVAEQMGEAFDPDDWEKGWARARKQGAKIVRVIVSVDTPSPPKPEQET